VPATGRHGDRCRLWPLTLVVLVSILVACGPARERPDLIFITVDTLRADHLGAYGHAAARTPHVDALARRGVVFQHATTPYPRTTPALATLLTGLWPHHHGARGAGIPIQQGRTLAQLLQPHGYFSVGVSASRVAGRKERLDQGFDVFVAKSELEHWRSRVVTGEALERTARVPRGKPLFLWIHYMEPHWPYRPPDHLDPGPEAEPCRRLMAMRDSGELSRIAVIRNQGGVSEGAVEACKRLYDAEIENTDAAVGELLLGLERQGRLSRAYVVFTADHGENFGESGSFYQHGENVHDASLRVPLIVAGPGVAPGIDRAAIRLEDVVPSVLGLLDVPLEERPATDGVDLSDRLRRAGARGADAGPIAFGSSAKPDPRERTARTPRFKLVDRRLSDGTIRRELYDLENDPGETVDVAREHPDEARRLARELDAWSAEVPYFDETADLDPDQRERLRALGYLD
jgi:arylsulfatase A-like enzyme